MLFRPSLIARVKAPLAYRKIYRKQTAFICLQEGDTALNLIIKSTKLRDTGDMYKCAKLLVQHGALSTYKDLVSMIKPV